MKNNLLNFKTCLKTWFLNKWGQNSIYLGLMKAYSIPTLPASVERFYNNIFVRIFRVIGGICFLMVVTKNYLHLPAILHLFFAIFASIQITLIMIILIIKFFYGIYTLIYKKEIFEVRNSPLNRYATILGQVLYCVKFGCAATGIGASFIAGGVAYDTLLVESGRDNNFLPFMAQTYNGVFGEGPNNKINTLIEKTDLTETETQTPKLSVSEVVQIYNRLSPSDRLDFMNELNYSCEEELNKRRK